MKVLKSSISEKLERVYEEFEETYGYGPCGAYAAILREDGVGQVAVCIAKAEGMTYGFTHYVIVDGGIIDLANPLGEELEYSQVQVLDNDEMPELVTQADIDCLREMML